MARSHSIARQVRRGAEAPPRRRRQPAAVVLLSGGLDSAVTLAIARHEGFRCHALTFDYGQRHRVEVAAARNVARRLQAASHQVIPIDLRVFGHSALTADLPVPKDEVAAHKPTPGRASAIPITYVPARNTIFLSYALALAEVTEARRIYLGVNAVDYSGYPDCRPKFIAAFAGLANLATRAGVEAPAARPWLTIRAPLLRLTKVQIIRMGLSLGVDFSLTHSCYDPTRRGKACGHCDACLLRAHAFTALGLHDPALA